MPTIANLRNCKIQVFADDHVPPHFHVYGPDTNCQIEIATLTVIRGTFDRSDLEDARVWAKDNMGLLLHKWSEFNEREQD